MGWVSEMIEKNTNEMKEKGDSNSCQICNRKVNLSDPSQKQTHIQGKRHLRILTMRQMGIPMK